MGKSSVSFQKYRGTPGFYVLLILALLLFFSIGSLIFSGVRFQFRYREFVHALSDATVYAYEHHSLRAQLEEDTIRVSGDNAYDLYFLFSKKQAKKRMTLPEGEPVLLLTEYDIAKALGQMVGRHPDMKRQVVSIDSIKVDDGEYLDMGRPLMDGMVIPVVVKTLIFG